MAGLGGARAGSGRKAGGKNKTTVERELRAAHGIQAALETGLLPLDVLLMVMRGGSEAEAITDRQFYAAQAAAPYVHPKLNTLKGDPNSPLHVHHSAADIDRRIHELLSKGRAKNGDR